MFTTVYIMKSMYSVTPFLWLVFNTRVNMVYCFCIYFAAGCRRNTETDRRTVYRWRCRG